MNRRIEVSTIEMEELDNAVAARPRMERYTAEMGFVGVELLTNDETLARVWIDKMFSLPDYLLLRVRMTVVIGLPDMEQGIYLCDELRSVLLVNVSDFEVVRDEALRLVRNTYLERGALHGALDTIGI